MFNVHLFDLFTLITAALGIIVMINRWKCVRISHFNSLLFIYIFFYCLYSSLLFLNLLKEVNNQEFLEDLSGSFLPMFWIIIIYVLIENEKTKQIQESERNWQITFHSIGDAIITTDINARVTKMNPVAEELTGWSSAEAYGKLLTEIFHTINNKTGKESLNPALAVLETGKISGIMSHTTLISKTGKEYHISDSAAPIKDENDKVVGVVLVFRDITETYKIQEKIEENEGRMRMIIESTELGMWEWTYTKEQISLFSDVARLLGYSENEIKPTVKNWFSLIHKEDRFRVMKSLSDHIFNRAPSFESEHRMLTKSGNWKWVMTIGKFVLRDSRGKPLRALGIYRDIDARKISEEKIYFHANLLNDVETGIFVLGNDNRFTFWNSYLTKLYGWCENEVLGKSASEVFLWKEYDEDSIDAISNLHRGESLIGEYKSKKKDGTLFTALIKYTPLFDKAGRLTGTVGIISDISARKQMETELRVKNLELIKAKERAEESDKLKTAFLANLSHEVRTPMNGILGFAELLKEKGLSEFDQNRYIEVIEHSGLRMVKIIDDLVDISKIEAGTVKLNPEHFNLNNLLDGLYNFFLPQMSKKGLKFSLHKGSPESEFIINTDSSRLEQVLSNLISNAEKFTDDGFVDFGYSMSNGYIKFYVKDSGVGVPLQHQKIIFERFRQAGHSNRKTNDGTGLGLAICKAFVEMMGGSIGVTSEMDRGAEFWFTIPHETNNNNNDNKPEF